MFAYSYILLSFLDLHVRLQNQLRPEAERLLPEQTNTHGIAAGRSVLRDVLLLHRQGTFFLLLIGSLITATWISFRVAPLLVPADRPEFFVITTFFVLAHCSANAVVCITMDREVRPLSSFPFTLVCCRSDECFGNDTAQFAASRRP